MSNAGPSSIAVAPDPLPSWSARLFVVGILSAEVVGWLFFTSDLIRAIMVFAVLVPSFILLIVGSRLRITKDWIRANAGLVVGMFLYGAAGMYGLVLGLVNKNGLYYISSDIYHWYGEAMLTAALAWAMLQRMSSRYLMGLFSFAGLALGIVAMLGAIAGSLGAPLAGGHIIPNLHIWRLEAGRGFPAAPLVFVTAIVAKGYTQGLVRLTARLALIVLLMVLLVTFKRSQWLTYGCLCIGWLAPQQLQWTVRWVFGIFLVFAFAAMLSVPGGLKVGKDLVSDALTYNPSYKAESAVDGRAEQMESVLPYVLKKPLGYGLGAKIFIFTPSIDEAAATHYIHNGFMYYAVQIGFPGMVVWLSVLGILMFSLYLRFGVDPEWDWLVYGSFAAILGLCVMSMALVCFHTPLWGLSLGSAALAIQRVPLGNRSRVPVYRNGETSPTRRLLVESGT